MTDPSEIDYNLAQATAYAKAGLDMLEMTIKLRERREGKRCGGCFCTGSLPHELDGLRYCDGPCWHGRPGYDQ
jgi:hypothetical protein